MLTVERHQFILQLLEEKEVVKMQELVDQLKSSESTIRRDLSYLEGKNKLKRVHGGASLLQQKKEEPSILEKSTKNAIEKDQIARYAAGLVQDGDCVFLDAGTTTYQMIQYITAKDVTVVTNAYNHLDSLLQKNIYSYLIGGFAKLRTGALIGQSAIDGLKKFRFDKVFLGVNGVHLTYGFTTPDPEEAALKSLALRLGQKVYFLADHTKFHEVTFTQIAKLEEASIITEESNLDTLSEFKEKTTIEVVRS